MKNIKVLVAAEETGYTFCLIRALLMVKLADLVIENRAELILNLMLEFNTQEEQKRDGGL